MGQILSEPVTTKDTASCQNASYQVGSSCMQGWRVTMEDCHTHILSLPDDPGTAFFGVYDGHGGQKIAHYAGKHLHKFMINQTNYRNGHTAKGLRRAFLNLDRLMLNLDELRREQSGSTAVVVVIKDGKVYCANCGDSRAVACVKGKTVPLSYDHKPHKEEEYHRIIEAGGWVENNRVNGNLALSRALGDYIFKRDAKRKAEEQIVTANPDVIIKKITPDWEFIIMACDGIWDCVTNEDVVEYVRRHIAAGDDPEEICEALIMKCLAPEFEPTGIGCDNMTVVIITFLHGESYEDLSVRCAVPFSSETALPEVEDVEENVDGDNVEEEDILESSKKEDNNQREEENEKTKVEDDAEENDGS